MYQATAHSQKMARRTPDRTPGGALYQIFSHVEAGERQPKLRVLEAPLSAVKTSSALQIKQGSGVY